MITPASLRPGDVLACRGGGWTGALIRLGAALRGQPNMSAHIAVVHHRDEAGTLWAIEGRPGGVGWRDTRDYVRSPWTVANTGQAKNPGQRAAVCNTARALLGTPYDWAAIGEDTGMAFGLPGIWAEKADGVLPGAVVCSSLAAYAYDRAGLAAPRPRDYAHVTPADWLGFIIAGGYRAVSDG